MCELSRVLSDLRLDGRPIACEHAVLISESCSEATPDWAVSILGLRAHDLERVSACRSFSASGPEGARYSGTLCAAAGSSPWHVRFEGMGLLRKLRALRSRDAEAGSPSHSPDFLASPRLRAAR